MRSLVRSLLFAPFLFTSLSSFANNPSVDAGEAGYVQWSPWAMFWGKGGYQDVIIGPTNFGYGPFHYTVERINLQAQTYDEIFDVIDANQIKIHFEVHFLLRPDPSKTSVKLLVEHFGGANWYSSVVKQPLRTFVRDAIGLQDSQTISSSQDAIQNAVDKAAKAWLVERGVPIILDQVSVGNFQFPSVISEAAAEKQANLQRLQAKATLLEIAKRDADIEAAKAEGIRRSQDIINQTLSPMYVQHEMVKAIEAIAGKAGNSVIYVPIGASGLPIVEQAQVRKADQQGRTVDPIPSSEQPAKLEDRP